MDYSQFISQLFIIIAVLVILVNIITEVAKSIFDFGSTQAINIFVTVLSVVLTVAVFLAYWQIKQMQIMWYLVLAFIVIGFMVAFAAMFGFDKLIKYFEDLRKEV